MLEIVDAELSSARLKVFGVGGGGSNAVNRMIQAGLVGVEFWVANTDMQALEQAVCPNRIQIGRQVTRGLGAGGDPEIGRLSAEEDREEIAEVLRGADMLFITAGMGGGTGTGAAPVVAQIAREIGMLTVAIVTKPFQFEGKKKAARANRGLEELRQHVDTLIAIPNQKLLNIVEPGTPFLAAMLVADEVLFQATRGISDLITGHGVINLDFADVKTVMKNRGNALLGCGVASGKNRAIEAAQAAVSSPLLEEVDIFGAEALLINVQGGPKMTLHEAADAARFISERVGEETDFFWGSVVDPSLDDEMRVTLIATGFTRSEEKEEVRGAVSVVRRQEAAPAAEEELPAPAAPASPEPAPSAPARTPEPVFLDLEPVREAPNESIPEPVRIQAARPVDREPARPFDREPARPSDREPLRPSDSEPAITLRPWKAPERTRPEPVPEPPSPSWPLSPEIERDLFLPLEDTEFSSYVEPREKAHGSLEQEPWKSRVPAALREDSPLSPRALRRHPLDKPAFMRKRMLD